MEKVIELLQITNDAAARLPEPTRVLVAPVVMAFDREAIAGQVQALAALPVRPKNRRKDGFAGRPLGERKRPVARYVPGLGCHRVLTIAATFEAEAILVG